MAGEPRHIAVLVSLGLCCVLMQGSAGIRFVGFLLHLMPGLPVAFQHDIWLQRTMRPRYPILIEDQDPDLSLSVSSALRFLKVELT